MPKTRQQLDPIGHHMKAKYESVFEAVVPQRTTYTILRIDAWTFHHYTRSSVKPFDGEIAEGIDEGALAICAEMMGCRFAYGQSDEYSFLATDFVTYQSEPWFGGKYSKDRLCLGQHLHSRVPTLHGLSNRTINAKRPTGVM